MLNNCMDKKTRQADRHLILFIVHLKLLERSRMRFLKQTVVSYETLKMTDRFDSIRLMFDVRGLIHEAFCDDIWISSKTKMIDGE